jgi:hypothetical protein
MTTENEPAGGALPYSALIDVAEVSMAQLSTDVRRPW